MNLHKRIFVLVFALMAFVSFNLIAEEEFKMPATGVSMEAMLHLFQFDVGEAEELAFIYAGSCLSLFK